MKTKKSERLLVVSNRLPVVLERGSDGKMKIDSGSGGLVAALAPVLKGSGGIWIGWPGLADLSQEELNLVKAQGNGFQLFPVPLSAQEVQQYYQGFSNEIIWPLFHDLQSHCHFDPVYWSAYQAVNRKIAEEVMKHYSPGDFVWVHDYQQMLIAQEMRKSGFTAKIGFFLHIPFPPLDIFLKLPWRFQIIRALLEYDLLGFQTVRDKRNFVQCVRFLLKDIPVKTHEGMTVFSTNQRQVRAGCFPISIDYEEILRLAKTDEVARQAWYIHETHPNRKLMLSVDRLDYTKGIPYRLEAFRLLLERHPELIGNLSLVQLVVPSRTNIPKYQALKEEIDRLVGEINSRFMQPGWVPIHYMFRSLRRSELLAYYRTCEIAVVTPIKDGMNLVAKEYVASNIEEDGVLILSEFAGVAAELQKNALLVNPYDIEGLADKMYEAIQMSENERRSRMRRMRRQVRKSNVYSWVRFFLQTAFAEGFSGISMEEEYLPTDLDYKLLNQELIAL